MYKIYLSVNACFSALMCTSNTAGYLFPVGYPPKPPVSNFLQQPSSVLGKPALLSPVFVFSLTYLWVQVIWRLMVEGKCENTANWHNSWLSFQGLCLIGCSLSVSSCYMILLFVIWMYLQKPLVIWVFKINWKISLGQILLFHLDSVTVIKHFGICIACLQLMLCPWRFP